MGDDDDATDPRTALEAPVRAAIERGDLAAAATRALQLYGEELVGYLHATARDDDLAAEAFAELGEDLWAGLPKFRWEASLRSWLYTLARRALGQLRRDPRRRGGRNIPLSLAPDVAAVVRTLTLDIQRTEVKDEFRALRDELGADDYELLLLRIDRKLAWRDIAAIVGEGVPPSESGSDSAANNSRRADDQPRPGVPVSIPALRKRFERVKERLRKLALERGLLDR